MSPKRKIREEEIQEENMLYVKPYRRKVKSRCGPAALKAYMSFFDVDASEEEIAQIAGASPKFGASAKGLLKAAEHFGFNAFSKEKSTLDDLRYYVNIKKIPVIVDWFWEDDGHYGVVIGIDQKTITFRDPSFLKIRKIPVKIFEKVWFDFVGEDRKREHMVEQLMIVITPKK